MTCSPPALAGRDLVIRTICVCVRTCVCTCVHLCVCPKHFFVDPITHWTVWLGPSIMVSTVSWNDEVVHKTCWFDLDRFARSPKLFFAHCTMNGGHFVDTITHWTIWIWLSIMVSTVSWDDEVVHNTCCFDLDLFLTFLQGHENLEFLHIVPWTRSICEHHNSLNRLTLTFDHGFNS